MIFKQGGEFENEYKKLGIKIVHLKLEKIYKINFTILNKINKAFELCDTIHFHNFHPIITPYASFFNKNVVYTEHGNFAFGRKKTYSDRMLLYFRRFYFQYFSVKLISNSNFTRNYLFTHWGIDKKKIKTVHNGITFNKISSKYEVDKIRKRYNDSFIVGTCSRLAGFKRVDRLINSFQFLKKFEDKIVLLIVGDGVEKDNLEKMVNSKKMTNVHFLGYKKMFLIINQPLMLLYFHQEMNHLV